MKKFILLFFAVLMLLTLSSKYKEDYYVIPNESIRIRIVPNSNGIKDQLIKKEIKNNIELEIEEDLKDSKTIDNSRKIIKNNLKKFEEIIKMVLTENNEKINYNIDYGNHYFPEKKYKGVKYKSGFYESLLIRIGKGEGNNWWCILFPPICSLETENKASDVEYTSYIKEIYQRYLK